MQAAFPFPIRIRLKSRKPVNQANCAMKKAASSDAVLRQAFPAAASFRLVPEAAHGAFFNDGSKRFSIWPILRDARLRHAPQDEEEYATAYHPSGWHTLVGK